MSTEWRKAGHDEHAFPAIATRLLAEARLFERVSPAEILEWVTTTSELTQQASGDHFGEPAISMYHGQRFHIDVLFWLDGTTVIHQHGFSGAFGVLAGSSIESSYDFQLQRRVNSRFLIGDIRLKGVDLLRPGDVRDIVGGEPGAHALFHLDRPSVSVVIRTFNDPEAQPQYTYRRPCVAVDPTFMDRHVDRRVRSLRVLLETEAADYEKLATHSVTQYDLELAYYALEQAYLHGSGRAFYPALAASARQRHGEVVDQFTAVFENRHREGVITALRARVRDADHRFFLALVLNLSRADLIRDMVSEKFGTNEPDTLMLRWIQEIGAQAPIGFEPDPLAVAMLRHMMAGLDFPDVIDRVSGEAATGAFTVSVASIANRFAALQASPLTAVLVGG